MLTEEQLDFYRRNGYVILDSVFSSAEMDLCSTEYDQLFERKKNVDLEATWQGDWTVQSQTDSKSTSVRFQSVCMSSNTI